MNIGLLGMLHMYIVHVYYIKFEGIFRFYVRFFFSRPELWCCVIAAKQGFLEALIILFYGQDICKTFLVYDTIGGVCCLYGFIEKDVIE